MVMQDICQLHDFLYVKFPAPYRRLLMGDGCSQRKVMMGLRDMYIVLKAGDSRCACDC